MSSFYCSGIGPLNKQHGLSLHQLLKWNSQLDMQRQKSIYDQQDLKKQKKLSKQNNDILHKQIKYIELQAMQLAKILQQQKTKHEKLIILVKSIEQEIYKEKILKHEDVMNKKEPDQFLQQKKILSEKENKLEKILQKLNASQFQISKKIDTIRSLRSQRAVHSNVFDKLQREYFDVEFYYKQLLIERTLKQKQLDKSVLNFNLVHKKSSQDYTKRQRQNQQKHQKAQENSIQSEKLGKSTLSFIKESDKLKNQCQKSGRSIDKIKTKRDYNFSKAIIEKKNEDERNRLSFKKKLKQILNDFGCQSYNQFLKKEINKNNQRSQCSFEKSNNLCEQISEYEKLVKKLQKQLHQKQSNKDITLNKKKINLKSQLQQFQNESKQIKGEIILFKQQFEMTFKNLFASVSSQGFKTLSFKQKSSSRKQITFNEHHELIKQMMTIFNDQILDKYFTKDKNEQYAKSRVLRKKSVINLKSKKVQNLNFQKKVKIFRAQTEGSQGPCSPLGNSDFLDSILNMHSSNSQKASQKGQKNDKLSILTEEDFIQQSKRIIKQANKKKSQFFSIPSINRK